MQALIRPRRCAGPFLVGAVMCLMSCAAHDASPSTPTGPGPTPPAPKPTITQLAVSSARAWLGDSVSISWASTASTGCTAFGAWSGARSESGTQRVAVAAAGPLTFGLKCDGTGGSASDSTRLIVPLPVYATSYLNAKLVAPIVASHPSDPVCGWNSARAYADFLQEGTVSLFVHGTRYDGTNGKMCLYRRTTSGGWEDVTAAAIPDNRGCVHPRKALVADFNGDRRPDVLTACHGDDHPPFPGEQSILLLSNARGTYDRVLLPDVAYAHGAAAGDVNGDGLPDVLFLSTTKQEYYFYINDGGTGSFHRDTTRLSSSLIAKRNLYSAELVDIDLDGALDVFLSGNDDATSVTPAPALVMWGDRTGHFTGRAAVTLPPVANCGLPLDLILAKGSLFLLRQCGGYTGYAVQRIGVSDLSTSVVLDRRGAGYWLDWLFVAGGNIVSDDIQHPVAITP